MAVKFLLAALFGLLASIAALSFSPAKPAEWAVKMLSIRRERIALQLAVPPGDHQMYFKGFAHPRDRECPELACNKCHGPDAADSPHSCKWCHDRFWGKELPPDHTVDLDGALHAPGAQSPQKCGCVRCHGADLRGGFASSCYSCHMEKVWE